MTITRREFLALGACGGLALGTSPPGWSRLLRGRREGRWSREPALPWSTQEVYAARRGREAVVAGGLRSGADSDLRFETLAGTAVFDPGAGAWERGPDLPEPRHHIVLAAVGDSVYGFGGFVGESLRDGFRYRDDVFVLEGGRWGRAGTMPLPLGEAVAVAVDGRVHVVTGSLHGEGSRPTATGAHRIFDPSSGAWSSARPAPTPRSSATGAVVDGRVYVVGGRRREGGLKNLGALERYDPSSDRWESLRPLPQPAGGLAGAALDGTLYCFGGEWFDRNGGGVFASTWAYTPATDEWRETAPMRTPRHGLAACALAGRVFAIGGNTAPGVGAATSDVVEALRPPDGRASRG